MGAPAGRASRDGKTGGHELTIAFIGVVSAIRVSRVKDSIEQWREVRVEMKSYTITMPGMMPRSEGARALM